MGSVFGGPQTVPQTQQTTQNINQATTQQQQQQAQTAQAQAQQQTIQPSWQTQGVGNQLQGYLTDIASGINPVPGAMQIAPLTGQQTGAINQLVDTGMGMQPLVGQGQQFLGQGAGFMGQAGQAITPQDINAFYNPMAGNVTAQLQNIFGQQNLANRLGATAASGGIGGDRAAVAQGILANQQTLGAGQIYSQLYQNALQAAQQQKAQQLAAGQGLAGTAFPTMQAGIGGLGTALQAATIPQQQQQQVNQAQYQAAQQAYQDMFLRAQALQGGIGPMNQAFGVTTTGTGLQGGQTLGQAQALGTLSGSQLGAGMGQITYPAPAILPQVAGLGSLALGAAGLFGLSDRKEKTDIKKLGVHKPTGLPLYAYRYKGDPKTYPKIVGPMAQDVAKVHPGLVAKLPKRQSGGSVLALPTMADWQSKIQPNLAQGMAFQPLFRAAMPSMGGSGTGVSVNVGGGGGTTVGGLGSGNPYSWAPGQPVSQGLAAQLAVQPASFWAGADPQNMGLGRINFGGPGGSFGLKRGGRVYQNGGAVDVTDTDNDTEPDDDTDDSSTNKVDFTKYAKGMNLLNQYAKSATPKTPQVQPIKMPDTPWHLGQMPAAAAMSMQRGGDADGDGAKTVPSADPDLAALRFEQTANLVQGHEVPPFQKGFGKGGPVKGYADAGEVESPDDEAEPAGLPEDTGDDSEDTTDTVPMPLPRPEGAGFGQGRQMLPPPGGGRMLPRAGGGLPGGMMQSPYMALMQAGLGMLAASGQRDARGLPMSPLGAIGAGGMAGMNTLQQQQQFALKQQALDDMMAHRRALEGAAMLRTQRPIKMTDPDTGEDYLADPMTGKRIGQQEAVPASVVPQRQAGNLVPGTPATATDAAALSEQEDDAAIPVNARLVQHGNFDYSTGSPGEIEKGFDLPTPAPITGPSGTMSSRAIMQDAEKYLRTGQLPPGRMGMSAKNPIVRQQQKYIQAVRNYAGAKAASLGMSVEEVTSAQRRSSLMGRWILSPQGGIAAGATGTVMRHIETLDKLYGAMEEERTTGTRSQAANRLLSAIGKQFGAPAAQSLDSAAHIVGTELIRALGVSGGGALADRQEAASTWSSKLTPEQWRGPNGTKSTMLELLAGRLVTGENLAGEATVPKDEFKRIVGPENYSQLMKVREELQSRQEQGKAGAPLTEGPKQSRRVNRAKAKAAGWTDEEIDAYERGQ